MPPEMNTQDWNSYLAMLELENPTLAALLQKVLGQGGLTDAVPPAGEYTTGLDYTTLSTALSMEYVGEVIQEYEAMLGPAPELYEAAVANGWLTPEAAQGLQAEGFSKMGTLQEKFAAQGGLRTLAGPYQAARTELLGKAMADMEAAAQKASADAYQLAQQTTGLRIQALTNAGQLGLGLTNAGVATRGSQRAAEGPPEGPPFEIPKPPEPPAPPGQPEWWQAALPALLAAGVTGGLKWLGEPTAKTPEERAEEAARFEERRAELRQQRESGAMVDPNAEERPPGWQGSQYPTITSSEPFAIEPNSPYGYGNGANVHTPALTSANPFTFRHGIHDQDLNLTPPSSFSYQNVDYSQPSYSQPTNYGTSYQGDYGYNYDSSPSYDYGTSYQGDYGYNYPDYSYPDYSYDYGTQYQGDYGYNYDSYSYPDYSYDYSSLYY